jgi:hypothetical protein
VASDRSHSRLDAGASIGRRIREGEQQGEFLAAILRRSMSSVTGTEIAVVSLLGLPTALVEQRWAVTSQRLGRIWNILSPDPRYGDIR